MMVVDRNVVDERATVRLVTIDLARRHADVVASWDDVGQVPHAAVVADGEGAFVLLTDRGADGIVGYRFTVDSGTVQWVGEDTFPGALVDGGQLTDRGVAFVRNAGGRQSIAIVAPTDLARDSTGPETF
jgi:hypothetical protein